MALGEHGENHAQIHFPLGLSSAGARNWSCLNHMAKTSEKIFKHGLRTRVLAPSYQPSMANIFLRKWIKWGSMVTRVRGLWGLISQRLFFASAAGLSYRLWTCHWQHLPNSSNTEAHGFRILVMHMRLHLSFILKYVQCTGSEMRRSLYKLMSFNRHTHVNNTPIKIYNISNPPPRKYLCAPLQVVPTPP